MWIFLALTASVIGCTFLANPFVGAGWLWDIGNGVGFAAFTGLIYLAIPTTGIKNLVAHEWFSKGVLVLCVVHAVWFLVIDGAVLIYLTPGRAPLYMWMGLVALILMMLSILLSEQPARAKWFSSHGAFRSPHKTLGIVVLVAAGYHIVASGHYLANWYQSLPIVVIVLAVCLVPHVRGRLAAYPVASLWTLVIATLMASLLLSGIRNLPL